MGILKWVTHLADFIVFKYLVDCILNYFQDYIAGFNPSTLGITSSLDAGEGKVLLLLLIRHFLPDCFLSLPLPTLPPPPMIFLCEVFRSINSFISELNMKKWHGTLGIRKVAAEEQCSPETRSGTNLMGKK